MKAYEIEPGPWYEGSQALHEFEWGHDDVSGAVFVWALEKEGSDTHECQIHTHVLMSNHVHLLVSASKPQNLSKLPQHLGRKYVPYFNHKYGRSGTLWEGRFKASESKQNI